MIAELLHAACAKPNLSKVRALSILQPWAWLIVRPDITDQEERLAAYQAGIIKDIENRSWATRYRGPFLIQAGTKFNSRQHAAARTQIKNHYGVIIPEFEEMQTGGIIGIVNIVDCVEHHASRWKFRDAYGFVLKDAKPLPFMPWKGQQGWFSVEYPLQQQISGQRGD